MEFAEAFAEILKAVSNGATPPEACQGQGIPWPVFCSALRVDVERGKALQQALTDRHELIGWEVEGELRAVAKAEGEDLPAMTGKLGDKLRAGELLGKQHGMFKDQNAGRVADSLEAMLAKSWDGGGEAGK